MSERLDQIEAIVAANAKAIAANSETIAANSETITRLEEAQAIAANERQELRDYFLATMRTVSEMSQSQDAQLQAQTEMLKTITEMQSEVRGLQVENRRILDRIFGDESS